MSSFLESIDILGALAMKPLAVSTATTSTAMKPLAVASAVAPPPAPTVVKPQPVAIAPQPIAAPAPTAVRPPTAPVAMAPQAVPIKVIQEVEQIARTQPVLPPVVSPQAVQATTSAMSPRTKVVPQTMTPQAVTAAKPKLGPSARAKEMAAAKKNEAKGKATAAANRAIAAARKLAKKRGRAASRLESLAKSFLRRAQTELKGDVVGADDDLTDEQVVNAVMNAIGVWWPWIEAMNAVARAGEIAVAVLDLVAALQAAGHVDLAARGQAIADRCQVVIDSFDLDVNVAQIVSTIDADANAWQGEARAALASGATSAPPGEDPFGGEGDPFATGGGSMPLSDDPLIPPSSTSLEEGVDWGDEPAGGGGASPPLDPGGGYSAEAVDAAFDAASAEAPAEEPYYGVEEGSAAAFDSGDSGDSGGDSGEAYGDEYAAIDEELQPFVEAPAAPAETKEEKEIAAWDKRKVYEVGDRARYEAKVWKAEKRVEPPWFPLFMKGKVPGKDAAWTEQKVDTAETASAPTEDSAYLQATDMLGACLVGSVEEAIARRPQPAEELHWAWWGVLPLLVVAGGVVSEVKK